ncbi:MAG: peptidoglycan-binding protein [Candidatus Pacebacteria bacterium]|nr:peptidoglycan-binding protein [Candidatus Paceibacterota bacterium]
MAVSLTGNFLEVNLIPYSENYSLIALEDEGYIYVKFYTKYGVPSQIIKTFFDKSKYSKIKNINKNKDQTAVILDEVLDYKFTSFLSLGTNSDEVKKLQERLKTLGYFNYPNITGYFGPITLQAVKSFQLANNIESVGYVGPKTREALNKY